MDAFNPLAGGAPAWLYIPAAIGLGALHGLEPGHSKTMMAAFIIAVRGTVAQAALLGLCAAFSHSLVVWLLAALALHFGSRFNAESTEPYFQLGSAILITGLALWMAWRTRRDIAAEAHHHEHAHSHGDHGHEHGHDHSHADAHAHAHEHGLPHEHLHSEEIAAAPATATATPAEYQDEHERGHAREIEERFAGRQVTTAQIALFGLTGGLLPCPAAFTIVLVCLQLKRFALGMVMVLSFSAGLAITLVTVGALAAWSLRHAQRRFAGLGSIARRLPYLSSGILVLLALFMGLQAWRHLG
jgi:ABC-type nickel/cobalt efflux system permease component RcnA